jgi:hypothetical protein
MNPGRPAGASRLATYFHVHLVSDSTGETLNALAKAVTARFDGVIPIEHIYALVRSDRQMERVLEEIATAPLFKLFAQIAVDQGVENHAGGRGHLLQHPLHLLVGADQGVDVLDRDDAVEAGGDRLGHGVQRLAGGIRHQMDVEIGGQTAGIGRPDAGRSGRAHTVGLPVETSGTAGDRRGAVCLSRSRFAPRAGMRVDRIVRKRPVHPKAENPFRPRCGKS